MLLKSIIATNLLFLAIAATIENKTNTIEYATEEGPITDYAEYNMIEDVGNTTTTERSTCRTDQWQCADWSCVRLGHKCDGAFHCEDGSDETRANCKGIERPMLGLLLHCTTEKSYLKDGVCPDICKSEAQPNYCAYALLAEQANAPDGVCALPDFIKHGNYKITAKNETSIYGYKDFSLEFKCENGKELVGEAKPECVNGTWSTTAWPYCSDTCKLNKKTGYTFTCKRDEKKKMCGDYAAIGTEVIVEKKDLDISNNTIKAYTFCTDKQVLNVSSRCVEDVQLRQSDFEQDVMKNLSDFENKFKETKQPSYEFENLVQNYRRFEQNVSGNTTELQVNIAVCDMNLDLMETRSEGDKVSSAVRNNDIR